MSLATKFSPENYPSKIFNLDGKEAVVNVIVGSAEVMEAWVLGDISAGVRHEDFLTAQSLLTTGLRFLYTQKHNGEEPTEQQLESIRLGILNAARKIVRG